MRVSFLASSAAFTPSVASSSPTRERAHETPEQRFQRDLASHAHEQDLYKHLATLSTGSLVLLVTFLEKIAAHPVGRWLIVTAVAAFVASVLGSVAMQFLSVIHTDTEDADARWLGHPIVVAASVVTGFGGFVLGVVALAAFVCWNLAHG